MKERKFTFSKDFLSQFKDANGLQEHFGQMFKEAIEQMLEGELEDHVGTEKYERSESDTRNYRNGHGNKRLKTDLGEVTIEVPRDRAGTFEPQAVLKRQTVMDNVADTVISLYSAGLTTRDIEQKIKEIYGVMLSDSSVSRITDRLLPLVSTWQNRPLEPLYLILWIDAIHFKVRENHRILSKALYVVIGLTPQGHKEVLGFWVAQTETAAFWMQVLDTLKERGVQDVLLLASDHLSGLTKGVAAVFPQARHQLCVIHQIRNSVAYVAYKDRRAFCRDLRQIYTAPTREAAQAALQHAHEHWPKYAKVLQAWQNNWEFLAVFFDYPAEIRRILYTTNIIENFNRMLRKYTKNRLLFPDQDSLFKAVFLAVENIHKGWNNIPVSNRGVLLLQFAIAFPDRCPFNL